MEYIFILVRAFMRSTRDANLKTSSVFSVFTVTKSNNSTKANKMSHSKAINKIYQVLDMAIILIEFSWTQGEPGCLHP